MSNYRTSAGKVSKTNSFHSGCSPTSNGAKNSPALTRRQEEGIVSVGKCPDLYTLSLHLPLSRAPFPAVYKYSDSVGKESACQCRRPRFDPWVGKIPWRKKWQATPVFLPRKIPWTEEPGRLQFMGS